MVHAAHSGTAASDALGQRAHSCGSEVATDAALWRHPPIIPPAAAPTDQNDSARPIEPYRQFAIDCIKMGCRMKITDDKKLLEQMAETWLRLAEQRARKGPRGAHERL